MDKRRMSAWLFLSGLICSLFLVVGGSAAAGASQVTGHARTETTFLPRAAASREAGALELLTQAGGAITAMASDGANLYANSGPRLAVLSSEANPQLIGRSGLLPAPVQSVALAAQTAVVTIGEALFTIDIGNPSQPIILGTLPLDNNAGTLLVDGSFVYAVGKDTVLVADISNPAQPQTIATVEMEEGRIITAAAVEDDLLLVDAQYEVCDPPICNYDPLFLLFDVSVPSQPELLASFPSVSWGYSIALDGGLAFVIGASSISVLDARDPSHPAWLSSAAIPEDVEVVSGPVVQDGIAYILGRYWYATGYDQLLLYDVATPTTPFLMINLSVPVRGRALVPAGDLIAIADGCGLSMIDPLNILQPRSGAYVTIQAGGDRGALLVDGDILYSAIGFESFRSAGSCLQAVDISDPATPDLLSALYFDKPIYTLVKEGNLLYAAEPDTLSIFDVTQADNPTLLGKASTGYSACAEFTFAIAGDAAFAHCSRQPPSPYPILFLDISDPAAPAWAGEYPIPDRNREYAIAAAPGILYMIDAHVDDETMVEIYIVDAHDLANAALLATVPPVIAGDLERVIIDPPALTIHRSGTLEIVNVLNPSNPQRTATLASLRGAMALTDGLAYFVDQSLVTIYSQPPVTPYPFIMTLTCDAGCSPSVVAAAQQDLLVTGELAAGLTISRLTLPDVQGAVLPALRK